MSTPSRQLQEYQHIVSCAFYYVLLGFGAFLVIPSFYLPLGIRVFLGDTSGPMEFGNSSYKEYIAAGNAAQQFIFLLDSVIIVGVIGLIITLLVRSQPMKVLGQNLGLALGALLISIINAIYVIIFSIEILTRRPFSMPQQTWDASILMLSSVFAFYVIGSLIMFIASIMLLIRIKYWQFAMKSLITV